MSRTYTKRTVRHPQPIGRITPRDLRIAAMVWRMRATTTSVVGRVLGISRPRTSARLRVLVDHGVLQAHVVDANVNAENWYTVTTAGARVLVRQLGDVAGTARRTAVPRNRIHHRFIIETWAAIARGAAHHPQLRLARFEPAWELQQRVNPNVVGFVPDACFVLAERQGNRSWTWALEADCAQEPVAYLTRTKIRPWYEPALRQGVPLYGAQVHGLLLVCTSTRRLQRIAEVCVRAGIGNRVALLDAAQLDANPFIAAVVSAYDLVAGGGEGRHVGLDRWHPEKPLPGVSDSNVSTSQGARA